MMLSSRSGRTGWTRHRRSGRSQPPQRGQATVETALTLPVVVIVLFLMAEVGLVIRNQLYVINIAREAARHAAVDEPIGPVPANVSVQVHSSGDNVRAVVIIRHRITTPVLKRIAPFTLTAEAIMRKERL
jgi:TadE-like protein